MNRKVEDFRRKLATTGFFEETDLSRSGNPEKNLTSKGRMHEGKLKVYVNNGEEISYMKNGKLVTGYLNEHSRKDSQQTRKGNIERLEIRLKKGTTEEMKNQGKKNTNNKKKIIGFIVSTLATLALIGAAGKIVYGDTIDNPSGQEQQKDILYRLENENLSAEEINEIVNNVIYDIEYNKIKRPLGVLFNVPSNNIILNNDSITVIDEYSRINGEWHVKEGETVHSVDQRTKQLISELNYLINMRDNPDMRPQDTSAYKEIVAGIVGELRSSYPDGATYMKDGNGEVVRIEAGQIDQSDYNQGYLDYLERTQGYEGR